MDNTGYCRRDHLLGNSHAVLESSTGLLQIKLAELHKCLPESALVTGSSLTFGLKE